MKLINKENCKKFKKNKENYRANRIVEEFKSKENGIKKLSFSKRIKDELLKIGFTDPGKTIKMKPYGREKNKEELRHFFLAGASVTDPMKEYHLEFIPESSKEMERIEEILESFSIHPKRGLRGKNPIVYLKDAGEIADVLKILGAFDSLMELENARILKEVSENVNRRVNFEAANINRTVKASVKQQEDILLIKETIGLERFESGLREVAEQRLLYPDAALDELSKGLAPPIGKSGDNHRLRKLARIAKELRDGV